VDSTENSEEPCFLKGTEGAEPNQGGEF